MSSNGNADVLDLSSIYQQIAEKAIQTSNWPDSKGFIQFLDHKPERYSATDDGVCSSVYRAPLYEKGTGPFGLLALIDKQHNPSAASLIADCISLFDTFVGQLQATLPSAAKQHSKILHVVPSLVPHICVAIFHEHPSLLPAQERDRCQKIDDSTMEQLGIDLTGTVTKYYEQSSSSSSSSPAIGLTLDALLLTPDGAMIAGFVEEPQVDDQDKSTMSTTKKNPYQSLKYDAIATARTSLGHELTSRPKKLIHVTLGRVLGFGSNSDKLVVVSDKDKGEQPQEAIQDLVRQFNTVVLPEKVKELQQQNRASWRLEHLSLVRNDVWLSEANTIYKTWNLRTGEHVPFSATRVDYDSSTTTSSP